MRQPIPQELWMDAIGAGGLPALRLPQGRFKFRQDDLRGVCMAQNAEGDLGGSRGIAAGEEVGFSGEVRDPIDDNSPEVHPAISRPDQVPVCCPGRVQGGNSLVEEVAPLCHDGGHASMLGLEIFLPEGIGGAFLERSVALTAQVIRCLAEVVPEWWRARATHRLREWGRGRQEGVLEMAGALLRCRGNRPDLAQPTRQGCIEVAIDSAAEGVPFSRGELVTHSAVMVRRWEFPGKVIRGQQGEVVRSMYFADPRTTLHDL